MTPTVSSRSRGVATLVLTVAIALGAAGCGDDAEPIGTDDSTTSSPETPTESGSPTETAESPSESPTPQGQIIDITISGEKVDPSGERVDAKVGEEITLRISSDAPGELHVHSTPEKVLPFSAGDTVVPLTIEQPGVVEVELHELGLVVVQLEVR